MAGKENQTDILSKIFEVLDGLGSASIVITVLGIVLIMRLHKIIPAASAAWKQHKETDQRLEFKRREFEKKHGQATVGKEAPAKQRVRQSRRAGDKQ
ncbi:MAG: hypothetical protein ACR2PI_08940 [Hyphomicrobiaceae bacterium]